MSLRPSARQISFLAALLLAGETVYAQQPSLQQQSAPAQSSGLPRTANSTNADSDSSAAPGASPADASFVEDTLKGNETQVELSQLAVQKASSDDVKDFSRRMIEIHSQFNQQLAPLAKQMQIGPNQKPSKQEKKEIAQLEQLSGPDFEAAYLQAMAKEQAHSIKQFKSEESAPSPVIQKFAKQNGVILNQHYETLQKIAQSHNVTIANVE